jgi:FtsZ-interacting cell division protein ZipA
LRVGLQLVDRQGPASEAQLVMFCEMVNAFAEQTGGVATFPRRDDKLRTAAKLDSLCAEVDVVIGLNVVSDHQPYPVARLVSMARGAGMLPERDGALHAKSDSGKTLFTLVDRHQRSLEGLEETPSVTLLLDLPRVAGAQQAFDRMADLAQQLVLTLGGDLVDDENRSLKPADLASIRAQIGAVITRMDDRGIPAGGVSALRLFS